MKTIIYLVTLVAFCLCSFISVAQTISTVAGKNSIGTTGDGGPATDAKLNAPSAVCVDPSGNFYIYDFINNNIRKVSTSGTISLFAGTGVVGYTGDGGPATAATLGLRERHGLTADASGNIFIVDADNNVIRKVSTAGIITTVVGSGVVGYGGDGGPATSAELFSPLNITFDASGNLYIADGPKIRKVDPLGIITTVAGTGVSGHSGDGGAATSAQLENAYAVAVDAVGNMYISDVHFVRKVNTSNIISSIAGKAGSFTGPVYPGDGGPATAANLGCSDIAVFGGNDVFIACNYGIRKIDLLSGIITTVVGTNATTSYGGDGGPATAALLSEVNSLAFTPDGDMYVADASNARIRKISCYIPSATVDGSTEVCVGNTLALSDNFPGGSWSSSNSAVAIAGTDGAITGIALGTATITYTLTNACGSSKSFYTVSVGPAPVTGIISGIDHVCTGDSIMLSDATVGGVWSMVNSAATIASDGTLHGLSGGIDTVLYTVTNTCGSSVAMYSVTVNTLPVPSLVSGLDSVCSGSDITLVAATPGGVWTSVHGLTSVSTGGVVHGASLGADTILYTLTNVCGSASAAFPVTVIDCIPLATDRNTVVATNVSIYPVPAVTNILLHANEDGKAGVFTIEGRLLTTFPVHKGENSFNMSQTLSSGTYVCRFTGNTGQQKTMLFQYKR